MGANASATSTPFGNPATLVLGGPIITEAGTLLSGQNLPAGAMVGRVTASGKLREALETADDGSEEPVGFLVHAVHAEGGDADCQIYKGGRLNKELVEIHESYTAAQIAALFDRTPITLETPTQSAH